ncbi:hypothetical protein V6N13_048881 [Hibiscus sabdariffa]|uniref:Uncharacterized protein n=1 Tax=Hibiscus sabdariffa TaxID=183260 RepID=A0ABR2QYS6_9ROSI
MISSDDSIYISRATPANRASKGNTIWSLEPTSDTRGGPDHGRHGLITFFLSPANIRENTSPQPKGHACLQSSNIEGRLYLTITL